MKVSADIPTLPEKWLFQAGIIAIYLVLLLYTTHVILTTKKKLLEESKQFMFNETNESIDLEKDFPQIEDINGTIETKPSLGSSTKNTSIYTKQNLPHGFIHCENPLCKQGGVPLGEEFRYKLLEMVKKRQEEGTISKHCKGYENMGPRRKRQCLYTSITVTINIKYKS